MKSPRLPIGSKIIRLGGNCHRYIVFYGGKITSFTTHEKDFLANLAFLFGALNGVFAGCKQSFARSAVVLLLLLNLLFNSVAFALPSGWEVQQGDVQFQLDGNTLNVTSNSQNAIVNYGSFNIAQGETVNFNFLISSSSILNRVLDGGASSIAGNLNGVGGNVFLVNPGGINFTSTANVNVGSLVASSLNISNDNFMAGSYRFEKDGQAGLVKNEGQITAAYNVLLAGGAVSNSGTITAPDGQVNLAVGDQITLNMGENHAVEVTVDEALIEQITDVQSAIENSGGINAHVIEMEAKLAESIYSKTVNNTGIVKAISVNMEGGKIRLEAASQDNNALVTNTGTLDAEAGTIEITADTVEQSGIVTAEGKDNLDGGAINVTSTQKTVLADGSVTSAKGNGENSNAGDVVIWSDGDTHFEEGAIINVSGGDVSGDGGFTEVSARNTVHFEGQAFGGANNGKAGRILIDPTNIRITAGPDNAGSADVNHADANNGAGESTFQASTFNGFANVDLEATNDITVEGAWNLAGVTGGNSLTLKAGNDININNTLTTAGGDINLIADADLSGTGGPATNGVGNINIGAGGSIDTNGGTLNMSGVNGIIDGNVLLTSGDMNATFTNDLTVAAGSNFGTMSGDVVMTADSDLDGVGDFTAGVASGAFTQLGTGNGSLVVEGYDISMFNAAPNMTTSYTVNAQNTFIMEASGIGPLVVMAPIPININVNTAIVRIDNDITLDPTSPFFNVPNLTIETTNGGDITVQSALNGIQNATFITNDDNSTISFEVNAGVTNNLSIQSLGAANSNIIQTAGTKITAGNSVTIQSNSSVGGVSISNTSGGKFRVNAPSLTVNAVGTALLQNVFVPAPTDPIVKPPFVLNQPGQPLSSAVFTSDAGTVAVSKTSSARIESGVGDTPLIDLSGLEDVQQGTPTLKIKDGKPRISYEKKSGKKALSFTQKARREQSSQLTNSIDKLVKHYLPN